MIRMPNEGSAAARARWLAEVAAALDDARQVIKQLGALTSGIEFVELYDQIDSLAVDIEMTRRMRSSPAGRHFDPEWSNNIPWSLSA